MSIEKLQAKARDAHVVRVAVRAKALHQAHPVFPGHAPIGHFQQHVGAGQGKRALLLDPVVAVSLGRGAE